MDPSAEPKSAETQFVVFLLDEEEYGLEISSIHEINRVCTITNIPHTPEFIIGVVNLRGKIIPVVDTRRLLGLKPTAPTPSHRLIVTSIDGHMAALLVDAVEQVLTLRHDELLDPPSMARNLDVEFVRGVARINDRLVVFLNMEKLILSKHPNAIYAEALE